MNLDRFPRVVLGHRPTPLEPLARLSDYLGGPRIYVKRDDCTGLALGGNKVRKLEFLLGEALDQRATTVLTVGGVQSNHCRQTAAAAARLGLRCELILPHLSRYDGPSYETSGNLLLDGLFGARLHVLPDASHVAACVEELMSQARGRGERPYFIPAGGSTALGGLGYVDAALELASQARERDLSLDHVLVTTGSCTTHAGLVVGLAALAQSGEWPRPPRVLGISVYHRREAALGLVRQKAHDTADLLQLDLADLDQHVDVRDDYLGGGYGEPTEGMREAVGMAARLEGLLVDPVYTGKTLAGLIDLVRRGYFGGDESVVFWHTGGTPALFAYGEQFSIEPAPSSAKESHA